MNSSFSETRHAVAVSALLLVVAGCEQPTPPGQPRWSDYAGVWHLTPDRSAPLFGNCRNINDGSGDVHLLLDRRATLEAVTGRHNGGYGPGLYRGEVSGHLAPPSGGVLRLARPGGEGRLSVTSVSPARIEGTFRSTDASFADPSSGRTPCEFPVVATKD